VKDNVNFIDTGCIQTATHATWDEKKDIYWKKSDQYFCI